MLNAAPPLCCYENSCAEGTLECGSRSYRLFCAHLPYEPKAVAAATPKVEICGERTRLFEKTVVAYTAAQGVMLGKFGMKGKCKLYEDSARVPLVVAGPGFMQGGFSN